MLVSSSTAEYTTQRARVQSEHLYSETCWGAKGNEPTNQSAGIVKARCCDSNFSGLGAGKQSKRVTQHIVILPLFGPALGRYVGGCRPNLRWSWRVTDSRTPVASRTSSRTASHNWSRVTEAKEKSGSGMADTEGPWGASVSAVTSGFEGLLPFPVLAGRPPPLEVPSPAPPG